MSKDRTRHLTIISPLILSIVFFLGCNRNKGSGSNIEKQIAFILSIREKAIRQKDIDLYMQCISVDYRDQSDTFLQIRQRMQKNFETFDWIDFKTSKQTIYPGDDTAMVVQDYKLVFSVKGKRDFIQGTEQIFLRRENAKWKIVKGL